MKNVPIGEVLKEYGYITDDHIKQPPAKNKPDLREARPSTEPPVHGNCRQSR